MVWKDVDASKVHRLFYPQVSVVVTVGHDDRVGAMPAIWCMPLSFKPPLVGVAISPEHETYRLILEARAFGINWLDESQAKQVVELGEVSGKKLEDKLSAVGFETVKGHGSRQPLVKDASAALECRLSDRIRTGTHELIIGEVTGAYASEGFDDYWNFSKYRPLLYGGTGSDKKKSWIFVSSHETLRTVPKRI